MFVIVDSQEQMLKSELTNMLNDSDIFRNSRFSDLFEGSIRLESAEVYIEELP